jgi:hypothetical protein
MADEEKREPVVIVQDSLREGPNGFIIDDIDVTKEPHFTVSEVAKFFFARSPHWVRWREDKGYFVLDGKAVGVSRKVKNAEGESVIVQGGGEGARIYTLDDVEKMAYALAERQAIPGEKLQQVLRLVDAQARLWGYITNEFEAAEAALKEADET